MTLDEKIRHAARLFASGAVITIGFLCFSGMYALWPILAVCIIGFVLTAIYEWEIYYRSIVGALSMFFKSDYSERQLANEYLNELLTKIESRDTLKMEACAELDKITQNLSGPRTYAKFSNDYQRFLLLYNQYNSLRKAPLDKMPTHFNLLYRIPLKNPCYEDGVPVLANHPVKIKKTLLSLKDNLTAIIDDEPDFFYQYARLIKLEHKYDHPNLTEQQLKERAELRAHIDTLEAFFASVLYHHEATPDDPPAIAAYRDSIYQSIRAAQPEWQSKHTTRRWYYRGAEIAGVLSGVFMILGTTYLLMDAFVAIPVLSTLPMGVLPGLIIPMAVIAGTAWGLLTYNAIMNQINDNLLLKRFNKISADFKAGNLLKPSLMLLFTLSVLALTIALSVCTAGTWWTVMRHSQPLFSWMVNIPAFFIIIIAGILGAAALAFNAANVSETLDELSQETAENLPPNPDEKENGWQRINPFRAILYVTFFRLTDALFAGHIGAISAVGDQLPGLSKIVSFFFGAASELVEDWHWFRRVEHAHRDDIGSLLDEYHHEGHSHEDNFPSWLLKGLNTPLFYLAAWWDSAMSDREDKTLPDTYSDRFYDKNSKLSFEKAWYKQRDEKAPKPIELTEDEVAFVEAIRSEAPIDKEKETLPIATPIPHAKATAPIVARLATLSKQPENRVKVSQWSLFSSSSCGDVNCKTSHVTEVDGAFNVEIDGAYCQDVRAFA